MKGEWENRGVEGAEENGGKEELMRIADVDGTTLAGHQDPSRREWKDRE